MTAEEMMVQNNIMRKKLTKENRKIYEDVLIYIRASRISRHRGEALLLEMLDHLLILQEKGEPAEKLFGDEPRNYCDALIRELPKPQKKSVFRSFIYFGLLCESWALATAGLVGLLGIGDSRRSFLYCGR